MRKSVLSEAPALSDNEKKIRKGTQVLAKHSHTEKEVGNRAHVTLQNGAALWYHRAQVVEFLSVWGGDCPLNELLKATEREVSHKVPLAGARALGILF